MKKEFILDKELYGYDLPEELIGTTPAHKRDESRLFVFDTKTGKISFDLFKNVSKYLPENSLMVLNETRVVPARIQLQKESGGKVEVLFLVNEWDGGEVVGGMIDRKVEVGDILKIDNYEFEALDQNENFFDFKIKFSTKELVPLLEKYGSMPIPKYIKGTGLNEEELRTRYQTIFAADSHSVAAPTASLHFTDEVFASVKKKGIEIKKITLDIGLGTFKPITEENVKNDSLHTERFHIPEGISKDRGIIAVGTTTVRALESYALGKKDSTNIFIHPPFEFKMVDHLITNFHLPNSSLMMLVEAFLQYKKSPKHLIDLYRIAIQEKFHFYSFGDSMLIV